MRKFKTRWEIQHNWQLFFPFLGTALLLYSSYKLAGTIFDRQNPSDLFFLITTSLIIYALLLKFFLFCFKRLENKWVVTYRWEMIRIFIVFAITGSSSVFVSKPVMAFIGITKTNLNEIIYWILYVVIGLICYQILLISFAWLFGQSLFFKNFLKRFAKRMGFGKFIKG